MLKKKLLISSAIIAPLATLPLATISCTKDTKENSDTKFLKLKGSSKVVDIIVNNARQYSTDRYRKSMILEQYSEVILFAQSALNVYFDNSRVGSLLPASTGVPIPVEKLFMFVADEKLVRAILDWAKFTFDSVYKKMLETVNHATKLLSSDNPLIKEMPYIKFVNEATKLLPEKLEDLSIQEILDKVVNFWDLLIKYAEEEKRPIEETLIIQKAKFFGYNPTINSLKSSHLINSIRNLKINGKTIYSQTNNIYNTLLNLNPTADKITKEPGEPSELEVLVSSCTLFDTDAAIKKQREEAKDYQKQLAFLNLYVDKLIDLTLKDADTKVKASSDPKDAFDIKLDKEYFEDCVAAIKE